MKQVIRCFTLMVFAPIFMAWPCSIQYPSDFFAIGGRDIFGLPEMVFDYEYALILQMDPEQIPDTHDDMCYQPSRHFAETDIRDLVLCLTNDTEAARKVADYATVREALLTYARQLADKRYAYYSAASLSPEPAPFDLSSYEKMLAGVPAEFVLYLRGAAAYYNSTFNEAVRHFNELLRLEPEQRQWRSVWAAYMLAKTMLQLKAPEQAIFFCHETRSLAALNFRDSMLLAEDSWGVQGQAERLCGRFAAAVHSYGKFRKVPGNWKLGRKLLAELFDNKTFDAVMAADLVQDETACQIFTAWACSSSRISTNKKREWLRFADGLPEDTPINGAGLLAWLAYHCGEMDRAARWVRQSRTAEPRALWVKAKLLMREGKLEEGTRIFEGLANQPAVHRWTLFNDNGQVPSIRYLYAESAGGLLMANDYAGALAAFLQAGEWGDAAFVAERLMTLDELAAFVHEHKHDRDLALPAQLNYFDFEYANGETPSWIRMVQHLFARRLARNGQWEAAVPHFPGTPSEDATEDLWPGRRSPARAASMVAAYLKCANDLSCSTRERARHFFDAARIIRKDGMELLGTEFSPDWRLFDGRFDKGDISAMSWPQNMQTPLAMARNAGNNVRINKRFHYRYVAAELMKHCANLLPKNDALAAEALYLGGKYLEQRDPQAADPFYKALVRRNPNLLIAQQADKLRWFPSAFTDEVLYTPIRGRGYSRKTIVLLLACLLPPVFLAGLFLGRRYGR